MDLLLEHALGGLRARGEPRAYEAMGVTASAREIIEARLRALPPVEEP